MYFFSLQRVVAPAGSTKALTKRRARRGIGKLATLRNSTFRSIAKAVTPTLVVIALVAPSVSSASVESAQYWMNGTAIRLAGADRYETATKVSEYEFGAPGSASAVVVASGENFPDALVAGPLASLLNAPLILTRKDELPEVARKNIKWVFDGVADAAPDAYIIGGPNSISSAVVAELEAIHQNFDAIRVDGPDRVGTALQVAAQFELGATLPNTIFVVNGKNFPDALSASGPASNRGVDGDLAPILLNDRVNSLNPNLRAWLENRFAAGKIKNIWLVGGTAVIGDEVLTEIGTIATQHGAQPNFQRLSGSNRYETAKAVAEWFFQSPDSIGVASGESFADALVGGQDSGKAHLLNMEQPFMLTRTTSLDATVSAYLQQHAATVTSAVIYGGPSAVHESVKEAIESQL